MGVGREGGGGKSTPSMGKCLIHLDIKLSHREEKLLIFNSLLLLELRPPSQVVLLTIAP